MFLNILFMRKNKSTDIFLLLHFFVYICCVSYADASCREVRVVWEMDYIKKDVYLTFCLWLFKTSQLLTTVKNKAAVDVYGICLCPRCNFDIKIHLVCYTYRRGLLRCSFRLWWAMRRP